MTVGNCLRVWRHPADRHRLHPGPGDRVPDGARDPRRIRHRHVAEPLRARATYSSPRAAGTARSRRRPGDRRASAVGHGDPGGRGRGAASAIERGLQDRAFDVLVAHDGAPATNWPRSPEAIILDLNLPAMSGPGLADGRGRGRTLTLSDRHGPRVRRDRRAELADDQRQAVPVRGAGGAVPALTPSRSRPPPSRVGEPCSTLAGGAPASASSRCRRLPREFTLPSSRGFAVPDSTPEQEILGRFETSFPTRTHEVTSATCGDCRRHHPGLDHPGGLVDTRQDRPTSVEVALEHALQLRVVLGLGGGGRHRPDRGGGRPHRPGGPQPVVEAATETFQNRAEEIAQRRRTALAQLLPLSTRARSSFRWSAPEAVVSHTGERVGGALPSLPCRARERCGPRPSRACLGRGRALPGDRAWCVVTRGPPHGARRGSARRRGRGGRRGRSPMGVVGLILLVAPSERAAVAGGGRTLAPGGGSGSGRAPSPPRTWRACPRAAGHPGWTRSAGRRERSTPCSVGWTGARLSGAPPADAAHELVEPSSQAFGPSETLRGGDLTGTGTDDSDHAAGLLAETLRMVTLVDQPLPSPGARCGVRLAYVRSTSTRS